jgi:hypothetical protein
VLLTVGALAVACGDDDDPDDARRGQVGSVSENATYAWIDAGAEGLYDYLSNFIRARCTLLDVQVRLDERVQPTDWRQAKDFEFQAPTLNPETATATVILATDDGDVEETWSFVNEDNSWRISNMPGLEECASI